MPKIANYKFTTLNPNLGVASYDDKEITLADIPGLVEGAHEGVGLGIQFLKHIERCKTLMHLIDITDEDLENTYKQVRNELGSYSKDLLEKKEIIVLNKTDLLEEEEVKEILKNFSKNKDSEVVTLSTLDKGQYPKLKLNYYPMYLKDSKIIVIKIGSSLLIDDKKKVRKKWLTEFAKDIQELIKQNKKVIIVSSGAIAMGCKKLNISKKNLKIDKSQAVASIGQIELMNLFSETFVKLKINISQILLTLEDTEQRRRALNAKRTFDNLFKLGFVPIVNENDTIATSEIKYGDNDRLASRVAQISGADSLILLSDVDGLYTHNPKIYKNAKLIKEIRNIDKDIEKIATKSISEHGTGGMKTKIDAAKICQLSGCQMVIANGLINRPIKKITEENNCTWFLPKVSKLDARKKWIISSISPKGALIIDDGAKQALSNGKSLLAAGIKKVSGRFSKGDHIKVLDKNNYECARGLSSFSSNEIEKIMGHHSKEIEKLLGYISKSEVIHKDDIVEV